MYSCQKPNKYLTSVTSVFGPSRLLDSIFNIVVVVVKKVQPVNLTTKNVKWICLPDNTADDDDKDNDD